MEINQAVVEFVIEDNSKDGGSGFAIVENPNTIHEVIRSPYNTAEEARQRAFEIAEYWGYKAVEITK